MTRTSTTRWAAAVTALALLGAFGVAAAKRSDPAVAWLDGAGPASWIVYPSAVNSSARLIVELDTSFDRSFRLDAVPASAMLRYRAFRTALVRINGREAAATIDQDWKIERNVEVAGLLRAGENLIEARVSNAAGPPALWLVLELPGASVVSDERWTSSWAGAATRAATRATDPKAGRMQDPERRVMASTVALALEWQRLTLFLLVAVLAVGGAVLLQRLRPAWSIWSPGSPLRLRLALGFVALLWAFLFVNNSPWLPLEYGFDASAHLEYAQFIQERAALPFADDGWQMFQPPLYYLLLASACSAAGVSPGSPEAAVVVRGVGLIVGLAHLALLGACMRLIFPAQPWRQIAGLVIGAFVPCMLYLHQYPANEPLVAMLSSAGILVSLHLLRHDEPRLKGHVALGFLLGVALLTKISAVLLVPPIFGALAARAVVGDPRWRARRAAAIALSMVTLISTCGWYYARVWARFGTPLVGGWDPRRGMGWWQDPGYRTINDFLRFGRSFTSPLFAGFNGFWDGLYVTLWGDGLLSGAGDVALVPPWWSPSLMSAALVLAVVPAIALLVGIVAGLAAWIRRPDATTGMLAWLAVLVFFSIASMAVEVPAIGADKASYGLLALVPFCALAARAIGAVGGRSRWGAAVLASALGVWALTSFATYWIDVSSGKALLLKGAGQIHSERAGALGLLREAHAKAPEDWSARVVLAQYLLETGGRRSEVERLLAPGDEAPDVAGRHFALAFLASQDGDTTRAESALRRELVRNPEDLEAHMRLGAFAATRGDLEGAVRELREALRIDPQHHASHVALSTLYESIGNQQAAAIHKTYAARIRSAEVTRAPLREE